MQDTLTIQAAQPHSSWSVADRALVTNALHSELRGCDFSRIVEAVNRAARITPANGERSALLASARQRLVDRQARPGLRGLPVPSRGTVMALRDSPSAGPWFYGGVGSFLRAE